MVAEEIAAAKVPVLVNPMDNLPARFEALGATLENAARLRQGRSDRRLRDRRRPQRPQHQAGGGQRGGLRDAVGGGPARDDR